MIEAAGATRRRSVNHAVAYLLGLVGLVAALVLGCRAPAPRMLIGDDGPRFYRHPPVIFRGQTAEVWGDFERREFTCEIVRGINRAPDVASLESFATAGPDQMACLHRLRPLRDITWLGGLSSLDFLRRQTELAGRRWLLPAALAGCRPTPTPPTPASDAEMEALYRLRPDLRPKTELGIRFPLGTQHVVFARRDSNGALDVNSCSLTTRLANAGPLLSVLGEAERPPPAPRGCTLGDPGPWGCCWSGWGGGTGDGSRVALAHVDR